MQRSAPSSLDLYEPNETKACFTVTQHLEHTVSYIVGLRVTAKLHLFPPFGACRSDTEVLFHFTALSV